MQQQPKGALAIACVSCGGVSVSVAPTADPKTSITYAAETAILIRWPEHIASVAGPSLSGGNLVRQSRGQLKFEAQRDQRPPIGKYTNRWPLYCHRYVRGICLHMIIGT